MVKCNEKLENGIVKIKDILNKYGVSYKEVDKTNNSWRIILKPCLENDYAVFKRLTYSQSHNKVYLMGSVKKSNHNDFLKHSLSKFIERMDKGSLKVSKSSEVNKKE